MRDELQDEEALIQEPLSYAPVVLKLFQGPLYLEDSKTWSLLKEHVVQVTQFFAQIGLRLEFLLQEGLAYLSQGNDEETPNGLPRLVKRVALGHEATILAVLLREALEEFDLANADSRDLFLTAGDIRARLMPYLGDKYDQVRMHRQFERYMHQMVKLGFLRPASPSGSTDFDKKIFQVMRILKAKLNSSKLEEIRQTFLANSSKALPVSS